MQQRTRRLAMLLGGSLLATVGFLAACSTDNGTTPLPGQTGTDSGRETKNDAGGTTGDDDDDVTPVNDAGRDCSAAPKPRSNKGVFCFGARGLQRRWLVRPRREKGLLRGSEGPGDRAVRQGEVRRGDGIRGGLPGRLVQLPAGCGRSRMALHGVEALPEQRRGLLRDRGHWWPTVGAARYEGLPWLRELLQRRSGLLRRWKPLPRERLQLGRADALLERCRVLERYRRATFFKLANRFTGVCQVTPSSVSSNGGEPVHEGCGTGPSSFRGPLLLGGRTPTSDAGGSSQRRDVASAFGASELACARIQRAIASARSFHDGSLSTS